MKALLLLTTIVLTGNVFAKTQPALQELKKQYEGAYVGVYSHDNSKCKVSITFNLKTENPYQPIAGLFLPAPGDGDMIIDSHKIKVSADKITMLDTLHDDQTILKLNAQKDITAIQQKTGIQLESLCHNLKKVSSTPDYKWD